ncbi:LamG-like jellyroll fold domain-containing protein [Streptomyces sp. CoH27]|uniref:LamG-like jellyroll fold domain-containing protein n=1 Tax=Streptomyces sp. CoH27 TaxID=2875763 RepID=UPI001CD217D7|nr:LamG-like jellyroll fold domain-containing protein [Streptomyces sp. CoH27]
MTLAAGISALPVASASAAALSSSTHKAGTAASFGLTAEEASAKARKTGKDTAATAATTDSSTLTAHPNGTFTLTQSLAPARKRFGHTWKTLDPTLHKNADGSIATAVTSSDLTLSGGGSGPLAVMDSRGRSLALSLPMRLPAPTLSGATATYRDVLSGVDLIVTADAQGGFSEVLAVKNAQAAANPALAQLTLATRAHGVTVSADHAGNITAADRGRHPVFTASAPQMWDSASSHVSAASVVHDPLTGRDVDRASGQPVNSSAQGPGKGAHHAGIATKVTAKGIALTPPGSLLRGHRTVYPVYIDPDFNAPSASSPRQAWTQTNSYYHSSSYWKSSDLLRVGDQYWDSPTFTARSFVQIGVPSQIYGSTVLSSQLNFTEEWSPSCTATPVQLWKTGTISSSTTWDNPPSMISEVGSQTVAHGWDSSCPAAGVGFDIGSVMQSAANAKTSNLTFGLEAGDETDKYGWKEFANTITVSTTYDHKPDTPTHLTTSPSTSCQDDAIVGDGNVTLYAGMSDPDGGSLGAHFQLFPHGNTSTVIAQSDSNSLTGQSGSTAVYVIPKATLEQAAGGKVTEFDWNVAVSDFKYWGSTSTTCHFSFDPTRPGTPVIAQPGSTTIGQPFTVAIAPPGTGTTPSSYEYQLNGGAPVNVIANSSGNATISVTPTRHTNVLSVSSLSAGSNYGDTASVTFNSANPASPQGDGDLTGDNIPDLLTVGHQNGLPSGLWLAGGKADTGKTTGDGHVVSSPSDIGANGSGLNTAGSPSDFDGAMAFTGPFTGSGFQDVLVYYPTGSNAGGGAIINGNGDGSPLATRYNEDVHNITSLSLQDFNGDSPLQLGAAGTTSAGGSPYPDLIGVSGDATNGYALNIYQAQGILGSWMAWPLTVNTPDGTADWNNWQLATMQVPGSNGSSTAMFLWNKSTGRLDLWENLSADPYGGTLTYTDYPVATGFHTGAALTLQAADINGDGTPDLWTTGAGAATTANLFTNLSTTTSATLTQNLDTLTAAHDTWPLNDAQTGAISTARDTTGALSATGSGGATWASGDLFSAAAHFDGTGTLKTSGPAVTTNGSFTVSAWVEPESLGGTVLSQKGSSTSGFAVYSDAASKTWRFQMAQSDSTSATTDTATASGLTAQIGAWARLTATYDASAGTMTLYVNGKQAATATHTTKWNATGAFVIGNGNGSAAFTGSVADVTTYQQALTAPQIAALADVPYVPSGTVIAQATGDFNGDGKTDVAHLIDAGSGHDAITVALADSAGDGGFQPVRLVWDDPVFGPGIQSMAAGDFNGDGKTDLALYYNYSDGQHDAIFTLTSTGGGGFTSPVKQWDDTAFGPGTKFMAAGDFNGDHKTDLALYYTYSDGQHDAVFTLTAASSGSGALATPAKQWDDTAFGPNTKMLTAGDFNGDGKTDLALFYNYTDNNNQHDAIFTMTAGTAGALSAPAKIWDDTSFGPNTKSMTAGDFNGDGKADIALFYNYADNNNQHDAILTLPAGASSPSTVWSQSDWGPNTRFMTAGDFNGDGKADLALYYDYPTQIPAEFTLTADSNNDGGLASPVRRYTDQ